MNKILFICFVSALFCSCSKKVDESINTLSVKLGDTSDYVNLSNVVSSSECIPLETNDSVIIDDIVKVISHEGSIYVADRFSVFKYDGDGKFNSKFDRHGIGPDEYIHISDLLVGEEEELWILSRSGQNLYNYAWNGTLKGSINLNCWATKMCALNLDAPENVEGYLPIDDKKSQYLHVMGHNYFLPVGESGETYFYQQFCDTIYQIGEKGISSAFYVDFAGRNIPKSFFDNEYQNIMDFFQTLLPRGYAYGVNWLWGNGKTFWLSYYYGGEPYLSILSGNETCKNVYELHEDMSLLGYPIRLEELPVCIQSADELIMALSPVDIMEYGKKNLNIHQQDELKQRIHYTGDDQNVVLLKLKL